MDRPPRAHPAPPCVPMAWDQHPLVGQALPSAAASYAPPIAVVGKRDGTGHRIALLQQGAAMAMMTPDQARAMAAELIDLADICDGNRW